MANHACFESRRGTFRVLREPFFGPPLLETLFVVGLLFFHLHRVRLFGPLFFFSSRCRARANPVFCRVGKPTRKTLLFPSGLLKMVRSTSRDWYFRVLNGLEASQYFLVGVALCFFRYALRLWLYGACVLLESRTIFRVLNSLSFLFIPFPPLHLTSNVAASIGFSLSIPRIFSPHPVSLGCRQARSVPCFLPFPFVLALVLPNISEPPGGL